MKDLTGKLGKLIFPDVEEKKGRRIVIQIVTGLSIALLSIAGMLFYSHQEVKQQQRFRQIKGAGITLPEIPVMPMGAAREESQEGENGNGVEDMGEIDKNAITFTYDWDSLLEANEDVKGWLYLPDTPIDLPVGECERYRTVYRSGVRQQYPLYPDGAAHHEWQAETAEVRKE